MTDKQQIEDIAKVIESVKLYGADNYARKISHDSVLELAKELLKHYQPKVPENVVVLTQEEYDNMFSFKTTRGGFYNVLDTVREVQSQETAKNIWDKLQEKATHSTLTWDGDICYFDEEYVSLRDVEKVLKQFGVEVE